MNSLIIVGAGGFGLEVAAYAQDASYTVKGFLDDIKPVGITHAGCPILDNTDSAIDATSSYIIAIGTPEGRKALAEKFVSKGAKFANVIHPQSYIGPGAQIGPGSIIAPFVFIGPDAKIGQHCIVNTHACAGHESQIGDYCILSPYAVVHGMASLGKGIFMGGNSVVTAKQTIGNNAKITAGAVVYTAIPENVLAMGNPAVFRKQS